MVEWLALAFWMIFGAYAFWFLFKAKTHQPIDLNDLALTWRIHKQETGCRASRIQSLVTLDNETVGFRCECGYEFVQKRLVTQKAPAKPAAKCVC